MPRIITSETPVSRVLSYESGRERFKMSQPQLTEFVKMVTDLKDTKKGIKGPEYLAGWDNIRRTLKMNYGVDYPMDYLKSQWHVRLKVTRKRFYQAVSALITENTAVTIAHLDEHVSDPSYFHKPSDAVIYNHFKDSWLSLAIKKERERAVFSHFQFNEEDEGEDPFLNFASTSSAGEGKSKKDKSDDSMTLNMLAASFVKNEPNSTSDPQSFLEDILKNTLPVSLEASLGTSRSNNMNSHDENNDDKDDCDMNDTVGTLDSSVESMIRSALERSERKDRAQKGKCNGLLNSGTTNNIGVLENGEIDPNITQVALLQSIATSMNAMTKAAERQATAMENLWCLMSRVFP